MSDGRLVVAVSNPASVDPLIRMGSALARTKNGSLTVTSVTELPTQIPVTAEDEHGTQQEAIIERALSVADSLGVPAEGRAPPSHNPSRAIVSVVENEDAAGLLVGASELIPFEESLLRPTSLERIIEHVSCDVYVERIGPTPAVPADSILVPTANGAYADSVIEVAADIGRECDMHVHIVTVPSPAADVQTIERIEQRLRTSLPSEMATTSEVSVIPGESVVETLVEMTGEHDMTVLGATEDSTLRQLLSGTVPAGLAKRGRNTLLLVANSN
ncbi:MAG: universal stress protein [Haloferacaceae archaeon]